MQAKKVLNQVLLTNKEPITIQLFSMATFPIATLTEKACT